MSNITYFDLEDIGLLRKEREEIVGKIFCLS